MFRPPTAGDWAADDDDDVVAPRPQSQPASHPQPQPQSSRPQARSPERRPEREPLRGRWARPAEQAPPRDDYARSGSGSSYRDRDADRGYDRGYDRGFDRPRGRDRGYDRDRERERPAELPVERGSVVSIKDNFGFISCVDREGDLFFHISEAPVDVALDDEVEFRVRYNQRSQREIAVQLVRLPRGSIVWEEIAEAFVEGSVTKGIPRSSYGGRDGSRNNDQELFGLIAVRAPPADSPADQAADEPEPTTRPSARRDVVRFSADSVAAAPADAKSKPRVPQFGDDVRFRVATHRKTGHRRAVELTITQSARDKLAREVESRLQTMTRELGVVARLKAGGGFIRCCERAEDVYFPMHELRATMEASEALESDDKPTVREGDEVSFFVLEEKDDDGGREAPRGGARNASARLTALRVVRVPAGTVSFEDLLQSDVRGVVTKAPKEPRNGPEVLGVITPAAPTQETAAKPNVDEDDEKENAGDDGAAKKASKKQPKKKLAKGPAGVAFRLADAHDVSYVPATGDVVVFDHVLDKRTRRPRATNVRVVALNATHRETGVISAMKDEFGFIRCAERASDAYFRFTDVMSVSNDFRVGTEVAFDVSGGDGGNVRATRVELLPRGAVQWDTPVAAALPAVVVSLPSRQAASAAGKGSGRFDKGSNGKGRVRVTVRPDPSLIDVVAGEFKQQLMDAFLSPAAAGDEASADAEAPERSVEFPATLSKFQRAVLHAYCDQLGLTHESSGEGASRRLCVRTTLRLTPARVAELEAALPTAEERVVTVDAEFSREDISDVRYNPRVGDSVRVDLAMVKRSRQAVARNVVLVAAATAKAKDKDASELPKGEGFIVAVKPEGFGFIQPADQAVTGADNLFFHLKEIVTGQTLSELHEGVEVQYRASYDEKHKKAKALSIAVVPSGTVQRIEATPVRGVVTKASLLQRLKPVARFGRKAAAPKSSVGRIRLVNAEQSAGDAAREDEDENEEEGEEEEDDEEEDEDAAAVDEQPDEKAAAEPKRSSQESKPKAAKKPQPTALYAYHVQDVADLAAVLRKGDEVEFVPHTTPKGLRAMRIRLVTSHAQRGVVVRVHDDLSGGVVRVDGDEGREAAYSAKQVLRGDVLQAGDRVEFALHRSVPEKQPKKKSKKDEASASEEPATPAPSDATAIAWTATSVLCLEPSTAAGAAGGAASTRRPESRSVNSTLLQAMRQVGASAVAKSRMAKGPDGTRGFPSGWRTALALPQDDAADKQ
ncbi:hypothetical protein P43SY_008825 [Pythium insidiosum]|uniref:Cold shock domain-containing protein n=1 Tax=Pythium insidiosum TaxID=114742 RepID=A0AAD5M9J8_PYTIN|nr:hypothetical protein P43SY_008825 [Pythium insidiosum]